MTVDAYQPSRSLFAKLRRKQTIAHIARPATLRFKRLTVSFTFDDFPLSAVRFGARTLEAFGVRGTFYACAEYAGKRTHFGEMYAAEDLARLAARDHEIGCHTFSHLDCGASKVPDSLEDISRNQAALSAMGLASPLRSFAYPYGEARADLKDALPAQLLTGRGIQPGLNAGPVDLAQLYAHALYGPRYEERCLKALHEAARRNAWIIFFTHDVCAHPTQWGTPTSFLEKITHKALQLDAEILPVGEVAERIAAAAAQ